MPITPFPQGLSSFGMPLLGSGPVFTTGNVFFVSSTHDDASDSNLGTSPDKPLATIDAAVGKCTASNGDHIVVAPGHTETLTAAAQIVFDVAGVTVVGIGTGSLRPKIVHDAAAADVDVTAANVTLRNLVFVASFADVVESIDLDAENLWLDQCEWQDEGANLNFVDYIVVDDTANACDGLKVTNCRAIGADAANDGFINCGADVDGLVFQNNFVKLNVATTEPVIEVTGFSLTNCLITHNFISRANTSGIVFVDSDQADNSGIVAFNVIGSADTDAATPFDVTGAQLFENYQVGVSDASGLLLPAVDDNA